MGRAPWLVTLCALLATAGCSPNPPSASDGPGPGATVPTVTRAQATSGQTATATSPATPSDAPATSAPPRPSRAVLDSAKDLGGTPHKGESLYLVVGQSVGTEAAALSSLALARSSFGDMQDYFIVQRSETFEGLKPGWWVVVEAHYATPAADSLQFARRGFPGAYVKRVTVLTNDPIPVYDELVEPAP